MRDTNVIDRETFRSIFGIDMTDALPLALATWENEGLLESVTRKEIRLREQPRPERTRSLISIVPDEYLEYEVARRNNLDLKSESVLGMLYPLKVGSRVAGRYLLDPPTRARVHLTDEKTKDKVTLRIAPQLDPKKNGTIRLIVECAPPKDKEGLVAFKKLVVQLTKLIAVRHAEIIARNRGRKDDGARRAPAYSTEITKAS